MAQALVTVDELVLVARPRFESMLVDKTMNFAAEAEFAIQQICKSQYSVKLARANPQAVHDAMTNVSAMGLTLNPALSLAYLAWPIRSPNYFYVVDRRIYLWNWSRLGKAANSGMFAVLLLATGWWWLGLIIAIGLLVLKLVSLRWLLQLGLPVPERVPAA